MKSLRITLSVAAAALALSVLLQRPQPTAEAKGKPGGGGGNSNAAFVFEVVGKGLYLTNIDDTSRVQLTFPRGKASHEEPAWSPDLDPDTPGYQGLIAYTELVEPLTGPRHLYVVNPDGTGNRLVRENVRGLFLAWTPNGKEIVMAYAGYRIVAVDVATGDERVLLENLIDPQPQIGGVVLSSLGMIAFHKRQDIFTGNYALDESGRIQLDLESIVKVIDEPETGVVTPSFSPDGTYLAYNRLDPIDGWQIIVIDLLTGDDMLILDGLSGDRRIAWSPDGSQIALHIRTTSNRGSSMDLFRITDWDDDANRRVIAVTQTGGNNSNHEVAPGWKPDWEQN